MTEEQQAQFETLAKPLIQWLNENCNPHTTIIIDYTSAEVLGGLCAFNTDEFVRD